MGILGAKKTGEPAPVMGGLSIVAVGVTVRGDIESNGTVKVEGAVEGQVEARNQVLVAKGGTVQGDIDAREAVVGGAVHGAIRASERVEIQSGAVVNGDIITRRIAVAEGGSLNGQIKMTEAVEADARPASVPAKPESRSPAAPPTPTPAPASPRTSVPVARVAVPPRLPSSGY